MLGCMRAHVFVCVRETDTDSKRETDRERERERERVREKNNERDDERKYLFDEQEFA